MKKEDILKLEYSEELMGFIKKEYEDNGIDLFKMIEENEDYSIIILSSKYKLYNEEIDFANYEKLTELLQLEDDYEFEEDMEHWKARVYIWGELGWIVFFRKVETV